MKQAFTNRLQLSRANAERLETINEIIEEYAADGYAVTLRQLYYQLVARDIIPNRTAEYAKLSDLLKKGRMAGIVDWDAIEDRVRRPYIPYWASGVRGALEDTVSQYRLDRMADQETYIEVWCEKDALSGIPPDYPDLPTCDAYDLLTDPGDRARYHAELFWRTTGSHGGAVIIWSFNMEGFSVYEFRPAVEHLMNDIQQCGVQVVLGLLNVSALPIDGDGATKAGYNIFLVANPRGQAYSRETGEPCPMPPPHDRDIP